MAGFNRCEMGVVELLYKAATLSIFVEPLHNLPVPTDCPSLKDNVQESVDHLPTVCNTSLSLSLFLPPCIFPGGEAEKAEAEKTPETTTADESKATG